MTGKHRLALVVVLAAVTATWLLARRAGREASPAAEAVVIRLERPGAPAPMLGDGHGTRQRAMAADVPSSLSWRVTAPAHARVDTELAFDRARLGAVTGGACRAWVESRREGRSPRVLLERTVEPGGPWAPLAADLESPEPHVTELRFGVSCGARDGEATPVAAAARWRVPVVSRERAEPRPNVLLVTVDTLRADHLGAYGYARPTSPGIDRLAAGGLLFRHAESVQSATWPALTSLHTSRYPSAHGVIWNGWQLREGIPTLAELLRAKGYDTSAFLTNMTRARHAGFSRLFRARGARSGRHGRPGDGRRGRAPRPGGRPALLPLAAPPQPARRLRAAAPLRHRLPRTGPLAADRLDRGSSWTCAPGAPAWPTRMWRASSGSTTARWPTRTRR